MSPPDRAGRLTVVVAGMVAAVPGHGGATWAVLQYLVGLSRLGHDVYFVEPVDGSRLEPPGVPIDRSANAAYAATVLDGFGLADHWSLLEAGSGRTAGLSRAEVEVVAGRADVLLNLAGTLRDPQLVGPIPVRVYVDLDPGFTQVWHETEGIDVGLDGHTHFVTVGTNLGRAGCPVPSCGRTWVRTVPPVVLGHWPARTDRGAAVTTVANWRSYGSVRFRGRLWGQKAHSWRHLMDLPARTPERLEVAIAIDAGDHEDLAALVSNGWALRDPMGVARTPNAYRSFVAGSKAELCVAKSGYVESRSGWLSDRSACYLASGRPVAAQDTGFDIPATAGLVAFSTVDEAAEALGAIGADYLFHAKAARALAEDLFDSDRVLSGLLEAVGA